MWLSGKKGNFSKLEVTWLLDNVNDRLNCLLHQQHFTRQSKAAAVGFPAQLRQGATTKTARLIKRVH